MTIRALSFRVHGWLGIGLGLVLGVMGLTGALMSFEDEVVALVAPHHVAPGTTAAPDLSPDQLIRRVEATRPGYRVDRVDWEADRARSHAIRLVGAGSEGRVTGRVDRTSGAWLDEPGIVAVFEQIEAIHRWLAIPGKGDGTGRQITGLAAIALLLFVATGLAMRWPRTRRQWRTLLVLDLRGGSPWRKAHRVVGIWLIPCYLLSAATGLWWSYDWYRAGATYLLTGKAPAARKLERQKPNPDLPPIDVAWRSFLAAHQDRYAWVRITADRGAVAFDARAAGARHAKMTDHYRYDASGGGILASQAYDGQSTVTHIASAMLEVHRGAFFGTPGRIAILLSSLCLPAFAVTGLLFWAQRRRPRERRPTGRAVEA